MVFIPATEGAIGIARVFRLGLVYKFIGAVFAVFCIERHFSREGILSEFRHPLFPFLIRPFFDTPEYIGFHRADLPAYPPGGKDRLIAVSDADIRQFLCQFFL